MNGTLALAAGHTANALLFGKLGICVENNELMSSLNNIEKPAMAADCSSFLQRNSKNNNEIDE